MKVRIRTVDSLLHELDDFEHRVASRAHEFFQHRGGRLGRALDDWIRAEREVAWRPAVEVLERDGDLVVAFAVPGVDPTDLDVRISDEDLVVTSAQRHGHPGAELVHACEFPVAGLARRVPLPVRVSPGSARAECQHGVLRITVPKAAGSSRRLDITEAVAAAAPERLDQEC